MVDILLTCSDVELLQFCLYINFLSWFPSIKRFFHFLFLFLACFVVAVFFFIFDFFREKKERKKVCMITRYDELLHFINISIKPPPSF